MNTDELFELMQRLYAKQDHCLRDNFDRSLSFQDGMFDRWERAQSLGFGEGTSIYNSAMVLGPVEVGAATWIGPYTLLDGSGGGLKVGSFCSISTGVHIYTHDTVLWALSGGRLPRSEGGVAIGDCVHVGAQSVILAGVSIGRKSVVAANSMVNADVSEGAIVGGTPARILGRVEGEGEDIRLLFSRDERS